MAVPTANLFSRDLEYLMGILMMLGLCLTLVIHPVETIASACRLWLHLNPMTGLAAWRRGLFL